MILMPGVLSQREERRSELSFHWNAKDCSLKALSGQQGIFINRSTGTTPGNIVPASGPTIQAGKAQPRFARVGAENALEISSVTGGQDQEQLAYQYAMYLHDLTVYMRLTGLWAAGAALGTHYIVGIGGGVAEGGRLRVYRTGTSWRVERGTSGAVTQANITETAGLIWPVEMLATFTQSTNIATLQLRGANGTVFGPVATGSGVGATGQFFLDLLGIGSDPIDVSGAAMRLFEAKISLGLYGFDAMKALS